MHRSGNLLVLGSVELTLILVVVPSYRLRITVLLSSGYRPTVEGLPNIRSSFTTHNSNTFILVKLSAKFLTAPVRSYLAAREVELAAVAMEVVVWVGEAG